MVPFPCRSHTNPITIEPEHSILSMPQLCTVGERLRRDVVIGGADRKAEFGFFVDRPGSDRRQHRRDIDLIDRDRHELARVTEERDIFKKAAAYFARESQ